jgi:hypothetical protein
LPPLPGVLHINPTQTPNNKELNMNRKSRVILVIASIVGLIMAFAGPSNAELGYGGMTKPDPNDPRIITTAGAVTPEEADANKAAYLESIAYSDALQDGLNRSAEAYMTFANQCVAQLTERDQKYADDMNARWYIMQDQKERIYALEATVDRKNAKIAELRAKIRALKAQLAS